MELSNYKSVTPLKKKRRKVTASAAVVLCLISLIVGVLCGNASADKDMDKYVSKEKYNSVVSENGALRTNEETYKSEINRLKKELADANITISNNEQQIAQQTEAPGEISAHKDETKATKSKDSGGFGRTLIIILLVIVIGVCGFFLVKIYLKKKNGEYDDEDYDDDDEYYDDEDDEDYDDDDDEYYDDEDDEDYDDDDDDEYYDDDEYEDEEDEEE